MTAFQGQVMQKNYKAARNFGVNMSPIWIKYLIHSKQPTRKLLISVTGSSFSSNAFNSMLNLIFFAYCGSSELNTRAFSNLVAGAFGRKKHIIHQSTGWHTV